MDYGGGAGSPLAFEILFAWFLLVRLLGGYVPPRPHVCVSVDMCGGCGEPRGVFTCAHLERVRSRECAACVDWSAVPKTSVVGTCGFTYKHVIEW